MERQKGREEEEEDVSSYWMTLKEREYTEILFHHLYIELKVDGKTEGTRRQGRRCKQLLDDLKGKGIH
jgi:hypothetical protein